MILLLFYRPDEAEAGPRILRVRLTHAARAVGITHTARQVTITHTTVQIEQP